MKRMNQTKKSSNIKYNLTIFTKNTYFDIIYLILKNEKIIYQKIKRFISHYLLINHD